MGWYHIVAKITHSIRRQEGDIFGFLSKQNSTQSTIRRSWRLAIGDWRLAEILAKIRRTFRREIGITMKISQRHFPIDVLLVKALLPFVSYSSQGYRTVIFERTREDAALKRCIIICKSKRIQIEDVNVTEWPKKAFCTTKFFPPFFIPLPKYDLIKNENLI